MSNEGTRQHVIVTDIHMPFWSMVVFMVKWAIASIPAVIILTVIGAVTWGILPGFLISSPTDKRTVSGIKDAFFCTDCRAKDYIAVNPR